MHHREDVPAEMKEGLNDWLEDRQARVAELCNDSIRRVCRIAATLAGKVCTGPLRHLGAYIRRQRARLGAPKAITATAHKLARILYNMLRYGVAYMKKDEEAYAAQARERLEKQLHRRAKELGYELVKKPTEASEVADATPAIEAPLSA